MTLRTTPTQTSTSSLSASAARTRVRSSRCRRHAVVSTSDAFAEVGTATVSADQLAGERYAVFNRFRCRDMQGSAARFEKRWAERPSRLAELDGFRFFSLLRRVSPDSSDEASFVVPEGEPNYMSMTIWSDKSGFDKWRKGDAFKEAHGGGSIFGFLDMILSSTMTLEGTPKPAFYDALIPISTPAGELSSAFEAVGGWRKVEADGKTLISPDVFVAQNRFAVDAGQEAAFEQRWKARESELAGLPGFMFFSMLRRDAVTADDGYNYISTTVWKSRVDFDAWRSGAAAKRAHAKVGEGEGKPSSGGGGPPPMFSTPPSVALWEGKLALVNNELGA